MKVLNNPLLLSITFLIFSASVSAIPKSNLDDNILDQFVQSNKVIILAHRGGSGECIESTLEAFQHAVDSGANVLEMDVQITKDGVVVVAHDNNLLKITGVDKNIDDLNYKDLPPITLDASGMICRAAKGKRCKHIFRIPTLEQVLKKFSDVVLSIELKDGTDDLVDKTDALIKKYGREKTVIWGHEEKAVNDKLLQKNPNIRRLFSREEVITVFVSFLSGTFANLPLNSYSFGIPRVAELVRRKTGIPSVDSFLTNIEMVKVAVKQVMTGLKQRGVLASFYAFESQEESFDSALGYNAGGLITEFPSALHEYLVEKGRYFEN